MLNDEFWMMNGGMGGGGEGGGDGGRGGWLMFNFEFWMGEGEAAVLNFECLILDFEL